MKAPLYTQILDETLMPFATDVFPEGFRFMQDNDPKHTSCRIMTLNIRFMQDNDPKHTIHAG